MLQLVHTLQTLVWGPGMLVLFLASGIRFTVQSGFFQLVQAPVWMKNTIGALFGNKHVRETEDTHSITQFQSFCTALAAALGTGNITGVATALIFGGPGAVFWMWVSAFFGMMTNYAENYLGIKYRYRDETGRWSGGAMIYMERGLECKALAVVFAVCCLGASFGMGNMVQGNSLTKGMEKAFHVPSMVSGFLCTAGVAFVLFGGMKRIAALTERLVPIMAALYIGGALIVLVTFRERIPMAFLLIFKEAFKKESIFGGVTGYGIKKAMKLGIARGIFSNEAGLGSSVMAHAQSDVVEPEVQGMWGILEIFIDTMLVCTMTALVILVSGVYQPQVFLKNMGQGLETMDGTTLAGMAFGRVFPYGEQFLAVATVLFAFATIIGWYYFGEQTAFYLGKEKGVRIYRWIYIFITFPGCVLTPQIIWELSDALNGMMAVPNLLALFLLGNEVQYRE